MDDKNITDHLALEDVYEAAYPKKDGSLTTKEIPLRRAMNLVLRDGYRDGVPREFGPQQEESIRAAFRIVAELGGRALVGRSTELAPGTVWSGAYWP
jgi:hypothetical protein